nr:hypothetical protein [Chamaesiphon minutus]
MEPMKLSFGVLIVYLNRAILQMKDPRLASNGTKYTIRDAVLGAFSMFFMQSESFLEHQRHMNSNQGKSNAQTLFGMIKIPTVPQIRNILDEISATALFGVFNHVYQSLRREGHLKPFEYLGGLLVALDGTQYFDSHKLNCKCCSSRTHKNGTVTYFHSAILPVIVAPGQSQVISLAPNSSHLKMVTRSRTAKWQQLNDGSKLMPQNSKDKQSLYSEMTSTVTNQCVNR